MKYRTKAKLKARKRICPANFARQKTKMAAADLPVGPSNTSLSEQLPAQEPSSTPQSSKSLFKPLLNMSGEKINRPSHVHTIKKRNVSSTAVATLMKRRSPKWKLNNGSQTFLSSHLLVINCWNSAKKE